MYFRPLACAALGLLVQMGTPDSVESAADKPGNKREDIKCLGGTGSPEELAAGIAKLVSPSAEGELGRLMSVPDCTAAIAAGWERVRRTMPETEHDVVVAPDSLAISRFLGLIEGRLHVPIPKTWEQAVKSARGRGQKRISFSTVHLLTPKGGIEKWGVERDGANWVVKKGKQLIKLPADDELGPVADAAVEWDGGRQVYVAVYSSFSDAYRLVAVDQGNGKVIWSSKVWGLTRIMPRGVIVYTSGPGWHVVSMRLSGESVVVFGFSASNVYFESFDRKTGENRCRFSTSYFDLDAVASRK